MSICGGCAYPFEAIAAGECSSADEACRDGCSFEDAVYRMHWAYDQLYERYKQIYDEKRILEQRLMAYEDDGK